MKRVLFVIAFAATAVNCAASTRTKWFGDWAGPFKRHPATTLGTSNLEAQKEKSTQTSGPVLGKVVEYLQQACAPNTIIIDDPQLSELRVRVSPPATDECKKSSDNVMALLKQAITPDTVILVPAIDGIHIRRLTTTAAATTTTPTAPPIPPVPPSVVNVPHGPPVPPASVPAAVKSATEAELKKLADGEIRASLLPTGHITIQTRATESYLIIQEIARVIGYKPPIFLGDIPEKPISLNLADADPDDVLSIMLEEDGYVASRKVNSKTLMIFAPDKAQPTTSETSARRTKQKAESRRAELDEPVDARRAIIENLLERFPQAYDRGGNVGSLQQHNRLNDELFYQEQAARRAVYARSDYGYGYDSRFGGYPGSSYEAERMRRFVNRGQTAGLKTSGDNIKAALYVDNCYIGDADQFRRWYNQHSAQKAGQVVKVTARRISDNMAYDTHVRFLSKAESEIVGVDHFTFGLHKEDFDRGYAFDQKVTQSCRQ